MKLIEELKARGLVEALTDPDIEKALEKPIGFEGQTLVIRFG